MTTALVGYGSHGSDIEAIFKMHGRGQLAIYDDDPAVAEPPPVPMVDSYYIGTYYDRRQVANRLGGRGAPPLHDRNFYYPDCVFAPGVVITPSAVIGHHVTLGIHTHVGYQASMTRTWVGDFSTISPGVTICGDVQIGSDCLIGANATVCDRVTIGDRVVIGAGAVIPPTTQIPDDQVWVGVPARPLSTAA